ncbi:outer membrane beta-barrel protein [Melittangium boletus]|uniref:outer membrane beta-barrel protein n=1 Tax=Melittangium boletus TaxID=83453 RepID=UPI003DA66698
MSRRLALFALLLAAPAASAQEEDDSGSVPLEGVGRISVQAGWRLTSNNTFYNSFYALPAYACAQDCARSSPGGPFFAGSFGYAIMEYLELGIDLFATGERLQLTNAPTLTNYTYGALVGVRFQTLLDVLTPQGVVPFIGIQSGPSLVFSQAEGKDVGQKEIIQQPWVGTVGATFRLTPRWGFTTEYRLAFARGQSPYAEKNKGLASYNAGGNWFALGLTYSFPPDPSRPFRPL